MCVFLSYRIDNKLIRTKKIVKAVHVNEIGKYISKYNTQSKCRCMDVVNISHDGVR